MPTAYRALARLVERPASQVEGAAEVFNTDLFERNELRSQAVPVQGSVPAGYPVPELVEE